MDNTASGEEIVCLTSPEMEECTVRHRAAQQEERELPTSCTVEGWDSLETVNLDANLATIVLNTKLHMEELE